MDQFVAGVERQVAGNLSVSAQYIHRRYADFMGLVDTASRWTEVTRSDPGPDGLAGNADDGGMLTAYSLVNPGNASFLYTNPAGARRRYDAVQVVTRKRDTRAWQMQASYTWSRSEGNVTNQSHANAGYWELGNPGNFVNPNRLINAYGRSPFDPTHEVKLLGTVRPLRPGGLSASAVYRYTTGYAWGRQVVVRGLAQGTARIRVEPNGARRVEPTNVLDLRIEQAWRLGGRGRLGIFVDVFNVSNRGVPDSSNNVPVVNISGPLFGQPAAWTDPRTVRLGGRVSF
jgi:hypothetical protein